MGQGWPLSAKHAGKRTVCESSVCIPAGQVDSSVWAVGVSDINCSPTTHFNRPSDKYVLFFCYSLCLQLYRFWAFIMLVKCLPSSKNVFFLSQWHFNIYHRFFLPTECWQMHGSSRIWEYIILMSCSKLARYHILQWKVKHFLFLFHVGILDETSEGKV